MPSVAHNALESRSWPAVLLGLLICGIGYAAAAAAEDLFYAEDRAEGPSTDPQSAEPYAAAELEELVAPVALYPDDLLAIVLPASTYPLQVVQAARFLEELEKDSSLTPDEEWDDAIVALLNYPDVVALMNEDLDWTWKLGEAVLKQQADVIDAIERFRVRARAAGNLESDEHQIVTETEEAIEIAPADPEVIYVPYYEPEQVVVYQRAPVYHYYPRPCPVYYYPYPVGYWFPWGHFWGVTTAFSVGWHTHHLHVHHHHHFRHPFFGHRYHGHYYRSRYVHPGLQAHGHQKSRHVRDENPGADFWKPGHRHGARPGRRDAVIAGERAQPWRTARAQERKNGLSRTSSGGRGEVHRAPRPDGDSVARTRPSSGGETKHIIRPRQNEPDQSTRRVIAFERKEATHRPSDSGSTHRRQSIATGKVVQSAARPAAAENRVRRDMRSSQGTTARPIARAHQQKPARTTAGHSPAPSYRPSGGGKPAVQATQQARSARPATPKSASTDRRSDAKPSRSSGESRRQPRR